MSSSRSEDLGPASSNDQVAAVEKDDRCKTSMIFLVMALLECFVNFDLGAMTVMLPWIQEPYGLSTTDLGLMGALPYVGLIMMSPFIGVTFTFMAARWVILIGLILNVLSLAVFALAYNKVMFYVARFLVGATQSFFIVYAPVWIGVFAPEVNKNMWMAIMQGSIVGGFMIGYLVTAIFGAIGPRGWRYSIATQMGIIAILIYFFLRVPSDFINLPSTEEQTLDELESPLPSSSHSPTENVACPDKVDSVNMVSFDGPLSPLCTIHSGVIDSIPCSNTPSDRDSSSSGAKRFATISCDDVLNTTDTNGQGATDATKETPFSVTANNRSDESRALSARGGGYHFAAFGSLCTDRNGSGSGYHLERFGSPAGRHISEGQLSLSGRRSRPFRGHYSTMTHIHYFRTKKIDLLPLPSMQHSASYFEWRKTSEIITTPPNVKSLVSPPMEGLCNSFVTIITDPYFCWSTLTISTIFYILSAIQFWTTKIAVSVYQVNHTLIYSLFVGTSITAPVIGVIAGSWIIDRIGAKYPGRPIIVHCVIFSWTVVALLSGISAVAWLNFYNLVGCIWLILFFGGGMLPPLTLITISNFRERLKPMASSICMCVYHILGYICGTMLPGVVMDITKRDESALYATYLPAILGTIGAAANVISCYLQSQQTKAPAEDSDV
ncbi:integral membrane family protein [Babesia ovis]|uniref:Integral membrane family protein n=1 Tax=Babesia ovis TaxID=5869 RepID=A0A9W5WTM5_BABOV|nr:integral membrane family protein [Babesia ovis]